MPSILSLLPMSRREAMLGLAAANRYHLAPLLEIRVQSGDFQGAISALRRSLFIEANAATAILAVVAALGTLSPE